MAAGDVILGPAAVAGEEFFLQVARGIVPGHSSVTKFGRNIGLSNDTQDIWNGGGDYSGFDPTGAEVLDLTSGGGNTGRQLRLFGLDANGNEITEDVTLDGAGAATTTQAFLRQWRARNIGATDLAVDVTATQTSSAHITMVMPSADNSTMIAAYTVPAGKTGYVASVFGSVDAGTNAIISVKLVVRESGQVFQTREEWNLNRAGTTTFNRDYRIWKGPFPALTDIKMRATTDTVNTIVAAGFDLAMVDN